MWICNSWERFTNASAKVLRAVWNAMLTRFRVSAVATRTAYTYKSSDYINNFLASRMRFVNKREEVSVFNDPVVVPHEHDVNSTVCACVYMQLQHYIHDEKVHSQDKRALVIIQWQYMYLHTEKKRTHSNDKNNNQKNFQKYWNSFFSCKISEKNVNYRNHAQI